MAKTYAPDTMVPGYADCQFCQDKGLTFGKDQPFRFCTCTEGVALRAKEPDTIDILNTQGRKMGLWQ